MRENEPVLLVLSVGDGKIILEKGEILYEKCQLQDKYQHIEHAEHYVSLGTTQGNRI